jgi:hypothetical protein
VVETSSEAVSIFRDCHLRKSRKDAFHRMGSGCPKADRSKETESGRSRVISKYDLSRKPGKPPYQTRSMIIDWPPKYIRMPEKGSRTGDVPTLHTPTSLHNFWKIEALD